MMYAERLPLARCQCSAALLLDELISFRIRHVGLITNDILPDNMLLINSEGGCPDMGFATGHI